MSLVRNIITGIVGVGIISAGAWTLDNTKRDDNGAIVQSGDLGVFNFKVGDCLTEVPETGEIDKAKGVPCSDRHQYEVYAETYLDIESENVPSTVADDAQVFCGENFEPFVGLVYEKSSLDVMTLYPTSESWKAGDKEFTCLIGYADGASSTGSFKNSKK